MVFSSLEFIFIFLPIFLLVYYIVPNKFKNLVLLIGSIVFYTIGAWENKEYIILILASIVINYVLGLLIQKYKSKKILVIGLIYNILWLFLFKYFDFILSIIFDITKIEITKLNLILPIGISFYTFQAISYLVDVYKNEVSAEKSLIKFGAYIIMFPQLISGPIVTYKSIKMQLNKRDHAMEKITEGCKYFILGLGSKVLLANRIGCLWNDILMIGMDSISTPLAWLGIIAYSLQIYFDFYGYSLMAIGLGKVMGFELPENFNAPYLSLSMTEFFRRWHMTLGNWFKNYIYIPLGGNRKGKIRGIINLFIVWLLTGLWHGANYNFILWAMVIFILIIIEKQWLKKYLDKYPTLGHIYMAIVIPLTWVIFAITDLSQLKMMFNALFTFKESIFILDFVKYAKLYGITILIGIICCTKLPEKILKKKQNNAIELILMLIIFWLSIYYLYLGLDNPFLYFRF